MSKHPYLLVFLLSAAVFGWIHATPVFGDPDAYYHLEIARRTAAAGAVTEFPWLPLTTLADRFADHHFLYHVALAPFLAVFGDFLGLKIATVVFAALAMTALAALLSAYGVRRAHLWTLLLLAAPGFLYRLLLTKATALAMTAFFLFLIALKRRARGAAFAVAFGYVWLHGGWPLLLVAAAVDAAVRRSWRMLAPTALGLAAGLVANPFFPSNIFFYREQIVQVALLGRVDPLVAVGGEWYPIAIGKLLYGNVAALLPLAAGATALAAAVLTRRIAREGPFDRTERPKDALFAYALSAVLLIMTLRQARHQEYFLPVVLLAGALVAETAFAAADPRALLAPLRARLGRAAPVLGAAFVALALLGTGLAVFDARRDLASGRAWKEFEGAGAWLAANVPAGETVFHARWDDFPQLWSRAPDLRYVAGLDALFFYRKDPEKYWLWRDISEGRRREGLAGLIEHAFGARVVFTRMGPDPLRALIKKDPSFERVYADMDAEVWRIRAAR